MSESIIVEQEQKDIHDLHLDASRLLLECAGDISYPSRVSSVNNLVEQSNIRIGEGNASDIDKELVSAYNTYVSTCWEVTQAHSDLVKAHALEACLLAQEYGLFVEEQDAYSTACIEAFTVWFNRMPTYNTQTDPSKILKDLTQDTFLRLVEQQGITGGIYLQALQQTQNFANRQKIVLTQDQLYALSFYYYLTNGSVRLEDVIHEINVFNRYGGWLNTETLAKALKSRGVTPTNENVYKRFLSFKGKIINLRLLIAMTNIEETDPGTRPVLIDDLDYMEAIDNSPAGKYVGESVHKILSGQTPVEKSTQADPYLMAVRSDLKEVIIGIIDEKLSGIHADIFRRVYINGQTPDEIIQELDFSNISDPNKHISRVIKWSVDKIRSAAVYQLLRDYWV